ncbi:cytochrome c oxidase assembly factor Coa1 family protein [Mucisphaera calidilacus]|uniref:cytochrome c oxidase assembly factor Coa1 family protein n=1 Tax=Mucisphaera calidilacus TaxID=2527982 RepID=UPI001F279E92|nr:cytochrome c oxidase assembly factor Coa1 family protein [Mucisphaera calidilacus]
MPSDLMVKVAQDAWWDQNKHWFRWVLVGVPLLMTVLGLTIGVVWMVLSLWGSEVTALSLERVRGSSEVVSLLGEPIEAGWLIQGSVDEGAGVAELRYVVVGPKGDGGVRVRAELVEGVWVVTRLDVGAGEAVVVLEGGEGE